MVKLQKNPGSQNHYVTVPEELRKAMGWGKGEQLEFSVKDSESLELTQK